MNTFIGANTRLTYDLYNGLTNSTAIGYDTLVYASNQVEIGNMEVTQIGGAVSWSNFSDIRTKKDIEDIGYGLDFITALRPVQFRMKKGDGRTDFGFIAQDIEALLGANYSVLGIGGDKDRTLSLRYTDFIAPMVKALQEQQAIIEAQKEDIRSQKEKVKELATRLSRLEALIKAR